MAGKMLRKGGGLHSVQCVCTLYSAENYKVHSAHSLDKEEGATAFIASLPILGVKGLVHLIIKMHSHKTSKCTMTVL